jgi:hypothetical protein
MQTAIGEFDPSSGASYAAQGDRDGDNNEPDLPPMKRPKLRLVPKSHVNEFDKLATNQLLYETASRLDDVISELIEYTSVLSDHSGGNEPKRRVVIKNIQESILPMLYIASRSVRDTGMSFAPFGSTGSLHKRNEAQKKKEVVDKKISDKTPALQMIDHFVKHSMIEIPQQLTTFIPKEASSTSSLQEVTPNKKENDESATIAILRPHNGTVYTRTEAIYATTMYQKGSRKRGLAVRAMIEKGYAPASAKTIHRLVQAYEDGYPPVGELWNGLGAPRKHHTDPALETAAAVAAAAPKPAGIPKREDLIEVTLTKRAEEQRADECFDVPEEILETLDKKNNSASKTPKKKSSAKEAAKLTNPLRNQWKGRLNRTSRSISPCPSRKLAGLILNPKPLTLPVSTKKVPMKGYWRSNQWLVWGMFRTA